MTDTERLFYTALCIAVGSTDSGVIAAPVAAAKAFRIAFGELKAAAEYAVLVLETDRPTNVRLTKALDALKRIDYHPSVTLAARAPTPQEKP